MRPDDVSISVYDLNGKIKVIAQFGLDVSVQKDAHGRLKDSQKEALQKAMEEALSLWELGNV
jgi:hypothetical protein